MRALAPTVPPDALIFGFRRGLRPLMLFWVALFAFWMLGATVWLGGRPSGVDLATWLFGAAYPAYMAMTALRLSARLRDRVAVSAGGIWYLPRKAAPTFIAWGEVARIKAHDIAQRLVLADARDGTKLVLEYRLNEFSKLRDFVLDHAPPAARCPVAVPAVFRRAWIDKGIFLGVAAIFLLLAGFAWSQGRPVSSLFSILLAGLPVVAIARDPILVVITQDGVVIKYPGWERTVPFKDISGVVLANVRGGYSWAAVIVERDMEKPIRLSRLRGGSIAVHETLRSAWVSAGGRRGLGARSD